MTYNYTGDELVERLMASNRQDETTVILKITERNAFKYSFYPKGFEPSDKAYFNFFQDFYHQEGKKSLPHNGSRWVAIDWYTEPFYFTIVLAKLPHRIGTKGYIKSQKVQTRIEYRKALNQLCRKCFYTKIAP
jgi:hypothetical protein